MDGPLVRYLRGHASGSDVNIIDRAIRGAWPITDDQRNTIVEELMAMLKGPNPAIAVKAARILENAVANDRRYELAVLAMLQKDQDEVTSAPSRPLDGQVTSRLNELSTDEIHALLEQHSQAGQQE